MLEIKASTSSEWRKQTSRLASGMIGFAIVSSHLKQLERKVKIATLEGNGTSLEVLKYAFSRTQKYEALWVPPAIAF